MRDGVNLARRRVPAVALVTQDFSPQGNFVARASGMPDVPRVLLPHPVAGTGDVAMRRVAHAIVPALLDALTGRARGEIAAQPQATETAEVAAGQPS